jgi:DNA helicase-2/ATP-dependent DNA helicase PcrA
MPDLDELLGKGNASVIAPAGHGKTELIAKLAAKGRRSLVLTHTHAGVHALRARLKRLKVPANLAFVDTIAGWSMRYAYAFPGVARPPEGYPVNEEWDQLYEGAARAIQIPAIRQVVEASYDRIFIDEYQDCGDSQHLLATALSKILPTIVFGDPMQGIFEFARARLSWDEDIYPIFPLVATLDEPFRWKDKNPDLGAWIAETREKLMLGEPIDLRDPRIDYRPAAGAFDMAAFFQGHDEKDGSFAAINAYKQTCYDLAKATSGRYQAIEEVEGKALIRFAKTWDEAVDGIGRRAAIDALVGECFRIKAREESDGLDEQALEISEILDDIAQGLDIGNGAQAASAYLSASRKHPRWKLYRSELWRDAERASADLEFSRAESMREAATNVRQRATHTGRKLPPRTVSTPLLLKGLEFDHVVVPDASHFMNQRQAQAKLFYVAVSRATRTLTITSQRPILQFPRPLL